MNPHIRRIILNGYVSPPAGAFLSRAGGIGGIYRAQQIKAINRLYNCGAWSIFDVVCFFATDTQANALINAGPHSYVPTLTGTPTFTAGQGFTGLVTASNFVNGPNHSLLTKYQRDSAHVSTWCYTGLGSGTNASYAYNGIQVINPDNGGNASTLMNCTTSAVSGTTANSGRGYYMGLRSGPSAQAILVNGVSVGSNSTASVASASTTGQIPQTTHTNTVSIFTAGGDPTNYAAQMYQIFADYMTAIGATVP
jgi:hypothetical protein